MKAVYLEYWHVGEVKKIFSDTFYYISHHILVTGVSLLFGGACFSIVLWGMMHQDSLRVAIMLLPHSLATMFAVFLFIRDVFSNSRYDP